MTAINLILPGIVGGVFLAALMFLLNRRPSGAGTAPPRRLQLMTPDLINMSHIPVVGIGGLGMVAAAVVTAITLPEIGWSLLTAVTLGAAFAAALIAYRSHDGDADGADGPIAPPDGLLGQSRLPSSGLTPPGTRPPGHRAIAVT